MLRARFTLFNSAPVAAATTKIDLPPTSLRAATLHRRVLRLLGGPFLATGGGDSSARTAKVFTDIIESDKKCSAVPNGQAVAYAGRAAALLNCGCLDDAAADLKTMMGSAAGSVPLRRIAASLAVRVTQAKLQHYIHTAQVQGSESSLNPALVSTLQEEIGTQIEKLAAVCDGNDFVPPLLAAEALLNGGNGSSSSPAEIAAAFEKIDERMFEQQTIAGHETAPFAVAAFEAQRAWATEQGLRAAGLSAASVKTAGSGSSGDVLGKAGKSVLSSEETAALLQAAAWQSDAAAPINVLDMGDAAVAGYGPCGASAQKLLLQVGHFLGVMAAHRAIVPQFDGLLGGMTRRGSHDVTAVESALKNTNEDVLDQLAASGFAASRLSLEDDGYAIVKEQLGYGYTGGTDFSNLSSPQTISTLMQLEAALLGQAASRAKVGFAAGLAAGGRFDKADIVLNGVLQENTYTEIWRAFLLKGNVAKKLGKVEESDAAFRALHSLKIQPEGRDLPLRDKHRDLSVF